MLQIVCGILAFGINVGLLIIGSAGGYSGAGIWAGIMVSVHFTNIYQTVYLMALLNYQSLVATG